MKVLISMFFVIVIGLLGFYGKSTYDLSLQHVQEFKEKAELNYKDNKVNQMKSKTKDTLIKKPIESIKNSYNYVKEKTTNGYNSLKSETGNGYNYLKEKTTNGYNSLKTETANAYDYTKEKSVKMYSFLKNKFFEKKDCVGEDCPETKEIETTKEITKTNQEVKSIQKIEPKKVETKKVEEKTQTTGNKLILEERTSQTQNNMNKNTTFFFIILAFIIAMLVVFYKTEIIGMNFFIFVVLTLSLITWIIGIYAPILTLQVSETIPLLGHTVLKYDSKSIMSTIENLWEIDNKMIAILVGLFSVIIPFIKSIIMYISIYSNKSLALIDKIGKWSMADVFVVSILLAILSSNSDKFTEANIQVGLYFFTAYVILSVLSSYLITSRANHNSHKFFFMIRKKKS